MPVVVATVVVQVESHQERPMPGLGAAAATTSLAALTTAGLVEIRLVDPSRDLVVERNHQPVSSRPLDKKLSTFRRIAFCSLDKTS